MTTMTEVGATSQSPQAAIDPALLARLTGGLGPTIDIEKVCSDFGQAFISSFPELFYAETRLPVELGYLGFETGLIGDLLRDIGDDHALCAVNLRGWSPFALIACGNAFVITLMENMLGALPEAIEEPVERPLSKIELDLSAMVFNKIGQVLKTAAASSGALDIAFAKPVNSEDRENLPADIEVSYGAAFRLSIKLGQVTSGFRILIPQKALLKTQVEIPRPKAEAAKGQADWGEQINNQVKRSPVTLEARIRLESLTLGTIARLAEGDVIPFLDKHEVHVDVSANGKDLYVCEFGRSGSNYMVRVKDNVSSDDEILRHLMG